jgi:3-oxoacyl-[acyl-carrier protein] reductase
MRLKDRVALITGGAAGIGRATAERFAEEGARAVICDLNEAAGQEAIKDLGPQAAFYKVNVADRQAVQTWVDEVAAKYGRIDVLVNNAGITRDGLLIRMEDADWELVLKVNLTSAFIGTRAAAKHMIRQKSGSIVNMASYSGLEGNRGQANYAASKAGLVGLTKTTAKELARKNVRCNAVAPGFIKTEMTDALPQQAKDVAMELIPMQRFGLPADVARAVAFLASDASAYITGQVLSVDGGMHT